MTANINPQTAKNQGVDMSRFGVFGDFPTRAMLWSIGTFPKMPFSVEATLLYFFAGVVFFLAHPQR